MLESSGFEVDALSDANEALERIERDAPDLVVADVLLQGVDGFELCRLVRSRYTAEQLPIVLCAGIYKDARFARAASEIGVQSYLTVGDARELVSRVAALVGREPAARPAASLVAAEFGPGPAVG